MPRYFYYFMLVVVFICGTALGLCSGSIVSEKETQIIETRIAKTVQDAVIEKLQEERERELSVLDETIPKNNEKEPIVMVTAIEKKLLSNAEMVVKKYFENCNHSEISRTKIPYNLVNCTENEVKKKYSGWNIEKFESDEIILNRNFSTNCSEHYLIIERNGEVALYNELTSDKLNFIEKVDIDLELLPEYELRNLEEGVHLYKIDNVNSFIEDYVS